jgi:hypothetical protein
MYLFRVSQALLRHREDHLLGNMIHVYDQTVEEEKVPQHFKTGLRHTSINTAQS